MSIPGNNLWEYSEKPEKISEKPENNLCQDLNPVQVVQVREAIVTQAAKTKAVTKGERKKNQSKFKNPSPYEASTLKCMKSIMKVLRS